eukprot:gene7348-7928_t
MNEMKESSPLSTLQTFSQVSGNQRQQQYATPVVNSTNQERNRYDLILDWVKDNIQRRQRELDEDLQQHVVVENRVLSGELSSIPGMQRHLMHAKNAKNLYESQVVNDVSSHGTMTRADLNRKYHYHQRR